MSDQDDYYSKIVLIEVDCEENPIWKEEIKVFGNSPRFLGYDFNVYDSDKFEIVKFIQAMLKKYNRPTAVIHVSEPFLKEVKIWTKEAIEEEIKTTYG